MKIFEEMEERYIKTNGIKLHTVIIGEGEPILFMHGYPDFWYGWKNVILGLKDEFKLILPDTRGINLSEKPESIDSYYPQEIINDIKGLGEALKLGKYTLIGHDWGGALAYGVATLYPELLKGLVIINAPHTGLGVREIKKKKYKVKNTLAYQRDMAEPGTEKRLIENNFALMKSMVFKNKDEFDQEKYIEAWSQPGAIKSGMNYYRGAFKFTAEGHDIEEWCGKINVPTLVIWGMKDRALSPVLLDGLEDYIKDLKIVRSENSGHFVMDDDPELVVSSIRDFIKS